MDSNTEVWKLVFSFFLPPFIYTKLINFKSVLNIFASGYDMNVFLWCTLQSVNVLQSLRVEEDDEKAEEFGQGKEFDSIDGAEMLADMTNM